VSSFRSILIHAAAPFNASIRQDFQNLSNEEIIQEKRAVYNCSF